LTVDLLRRATAANPAVTLARTLSDTFAGIAPSSVPAFVVAQFIGGLGALTLARFLHPQAPGLVLVPTEGARP
jgi:glycerol uptake facilitator-like aquaporin